MTKLIDLLNDIRKYKALKARFNAMTSEEQEKIPYSEWKKFYELKHRLKALGITV